MVLNGQSFIDGFINKNSPKIKGTGLMLGKHLVSMEAR